jgi:NAD dependent epimerase/dehydratase
MKGRAVLVTGADGFIGSHLAERLVHDGARVRVVCLYTSSGSRGWLDASPAAEQMDIRPGDIRDKEFVDAVTDGVEIVFHLAALVSIPYSYQAPRSFLETNVMGTMNVLEAARRHGVSRVVHTSTSEVYGTPDTLPIREEHPLRAQSPYSASKIAADKLCEAYGSSFGLPVVVLRPFNTYGPRQSMRAVLPTIIAQLLAGQQRVRLGDLRPQRDLTFVSDTVDGFVRAGERPGLEGEVVQLGTGRTVSIGELFSLTGRVLGIHADVEQELERIRPARSEVMVLQSDPSRAKALLEWVPRVSLEDGIRATADWQANNLSVRRPDMYHV